MFSDLDGPNCNKLGEVTGPSSALERLVFGFRYVAPFQNKDYSTATGIKS